jgi:hypothetical protein
MAVGSALTLVALGEPAYGELLGHHLREGFGANARRDLAMQWYNASLSALEQGAEPAFMPGQPERTPLLRGAMMRLQGGQGAGGPVPVAQPAPAPQPVPQPLPTGNAMPTFQVNQ